MTALQKQQRAEKDHARYIKKRDSETPEQREARLSVLRARKAQSRARKSSEVREVRLAQDRVRHAQSRAMETTDVREDRLRTVRESMTQLRATQSNEQKEIRLEKDRVSHSSTRNEETPEQRQARLERNRIYQARRRESENAAIDKFNRIINTFCDRYCEVCLKSCYPNQIYEVTYSNAARSYLPEELLAKNKLQLCSRCKTHLTSTKLTYPSRAYWNLLDPGKIPECIELLTRLEIKLLKRIIPYTKVIKYDGLFGQYGFQGQAVLFAQDIHEVSERLPNMLPRSVDNVGEVVITETLENLDRTREFIVDRPRVMEALDWLIQNNPLYHDVQPDSNANINVEGIIRVPNRQEEPAPNTEQQSAYKSFGEFAVLHASWNQANEVSLCLDMLEHNVVLWL